MSPPSELPTLTVVRPGTPARARDAGRLRAARHARWLSYVSLVWMLVEGVLGLIAGAQTHSIAVITWAIGSAVEAAAAVIVIVRFTGATGSPRLPSAEPRGGWRPASSYWSRTSSYKAGVKLINGSEPERTWLAVALLASSVVLMPALGWAKQRLGKRLGSAATAGEGTQNLLRAAQGAVGLVGLLAGSAGLGFLDPVAALVIAAIAAREGVELWRGEGCACHMMPVLESADGTCADQGRECC